MSLYDLDFRLYLTSVHLYLTSVQIFSEFVLRDENEDLSDGTPDERSVVIDLHAEIQLDLLWSRNHAR